MVCESSSLSFTSVIPCVVWRYAIWSFNSVHNHPYIKFVMVYNPWFSISQVRQNYWHPLSQIRYGMYSKKIIWILVLRCPIWSVYPIKMGCLGSFIRETGFKWNLAFQPWANFCDESLDREYIINCTVIYQNCASCFSFVIMGLDNL